MNWTYLSSAYGDQTAPIVSGRDRCDGSVRDAITRIQAGETVYIKDWHLGDVCPVPSLFADDWLNNGDDFKFCYAGSKGTRTPLHRDVYASYSWSTNVVGKKLWRLFPPSVASGLRRDPTDRTSQLGESVDITPDPPGWSGWPDAVKAALSITQEEGETIFVPSDWYHEVTNLTDCISLNRNWCNSVNLPTIYAAIVHEVEDVQSSLEDVRDMLSSQDGWQKEWTAIVQNIATQDAGWAWKGFWEMVERNSRNPAAEAGLRPSTEFTHGQVQPLITDFATRPEFEWLESEVCECVQRCKQLLMS